MVSERGWMAGMAVSHISGCLFVRRRVRRRPTPFFVFFDLLAFLTTSLRVVLRYLDEDLSFASKMYDTCICFFVYILYQYLPRCKKPILL